MSLMHAAYHSMSNMYLLYRSAICLSDFVQCHSGDWSDSERI